MSIQEEIITRRNFYGTCQKSAATELPGDKVTRIIPRENKVKAGYFKNATENTSKILLTRHSINRHKMVQV